jgi:hypothetical protein
MRFPQRSFKVRPPPRVRLQGRTAVPPRLMHPQAPHQFDDRLAADRPGLCGRPDPLVRQQGRDLRDIVPLVHPCLETLAQARVVAHVREVAKGACGQPGRAPTPAPFDGHLEPFTPPCAGHDDALNARPDKLLALRQGRSGRVPSRGHVLRQRRDRLALGVRQ